MSRTSPDPYRGFQNERVGDKVLRREGRIERFLFGLLYAMTQGNHINHALAFVLHITEDIQLLSFSFRGEFGFARMPGWMPYVFNPLSAKPTDANHFAILFYFAFATVVLTAILTGMVAFSMQGSQMKVVWPLHVLRILTTLLSTILFIPVLEIFARALACYDFETNEPLLLHDLTACRASEWFHLCVLSGFGILVLLLEVPVLSLVFFRIAPSSKDPHSKATGRIDFLYTLIRVVLVFVLEFCEHIPTALIATVIICSLLVLFLMTRYQPYFDGRINDMRAGLSSASLWSGIQAAVIWDIRGKKLTHHQARDTSIGSPAAFAVLCALLIPGFIVGYLVCKKGRERVTARVIARIQARQHQIEEGVSTKKRHEPSSSISRTGMLSGDINPVFIPYDIREMAIQKAGEIVKTHTVEPIRVFTCPAEVEIACRFLQHNTQPEALALAQTIFEVGTQEFEKCAELWLMKAYYIAAFRVEDMGEVSRCLTWARRLNPSLDIRFFIFFEERTMEQEVRKEDLQTSRLNIASYAELTAMESGAKRYHLESLLAVKALWGYLKSDKVSSGSISYLLKRVERNKSKADELYQGILDKYPKSKQVLRRYSQFLFTVADDHDKAKKLLERAEDIENMETRETPINYLRASSTHQPLKGDDIPSRDTQPREISARELEALDDPTGEKDEEPGSDRTESDRVQSKMEAGQDLEAAQNDDKTSVPERRAFFAPSPTMQDYASPAYPLPEDKPQSYNFVVDRKSSQTYGDRKGPGSVATSTASSQREARQQKYFRSLLQTKMRAPIQLFEWQMSFGTLFLLGILVVGVALSAMMYSQVESALQETYARARPRGTVARFCHTARNIDAIAKGLITVPDGNKTAAIQKVLDEVAVYMRNPWGTSILPMLQRDNLDDPRTALIRITRPPSMTLESMNPFVLGQHIHNQAASLVYKPISIRLDPTGKATDLRFFLDNLLNMVNLYDGTASAGMNAFLSYINSSQSVLIFLLIALPIASLLVAVFIFRPIVNDTTERQTRMLSLMLQVPKKYISDKLDGLELEIENLMEEMDCEDGGKGIGGDVGMMGNSLPQENVMNKHGQKKLTKMFSLSLALFAVFGTTMFAPALQEAKYAKEAVLTIKYLSDRSFYTAFISTLGSETAAKDEASWIPDTQIAHFKYNINKWKEAQSKLSSAAGGSPSIYDFASVLPLLQRGGICFLGTGACDPSVRTYRYDIGLTPELTMAPMDAIVDNWIDAAEQFAAARADNRTFANPMYIKMTELRDDIVKGSIMINNVLVEQVSTDSHTTRAVLFFLFSVGAAVLVGSYFKVFRRIANELKSDMESICWLFFSLPPALVETIPSIKRFIESGGAVLPVEERLK